ncbi:FMR [Mytilus coruscus]|uniref:FMR n=1 Tax=Mytilus coruscus TaxID=42192 RepID=A0A6J8EUY0_MYTCO|nr:FMR [Mytilus coruscus]
MDTKPVYTEIFMVPFNLMGLAIGREGANIKKSRQIKGVLSVRNEKQPDGYRFTVIGESHKAVNEARCVLEFKQKAYTVPKHLAGRVIGKNGNVIKEVIDKSLVKKIETQNKEENAVVTFNIIGSPEAIQCAILMLNNKLDAIECVNKRQNERFQRRYAVNADKKKLSKSGGQNSVKGKYNVHRRQIQGKKPSRSKTPDQDCFVFFIENKMFRRIDYVEKQKQNQRALLKLSRGNVKMQHQSQRKLTKRELPIDLQLLIGDIVHSNPSFTENKQCADQHNCSKTKTVKAKVKNYIIETDHGHINRTKARFQYNCLGKYIEAAINNKGLNGVLRVGTLTDCDDYRGTGISLGSPEFSNEEGEIYLYDRGTCISLDSPRISNEKGDICIEKCIENESDREDEQSWWLTPEQTKDTWEEWDSDEESSISSELEQFKIDETNTRSNCLSNSLTNQLLALPDDTETLVPYKVGGIIRTSTSDVKNQLSSVEDSAEALEKK